MSKAKYFIGGEGTGDKLFFCSYFSVPLPEADLPEHRRCEMAGDAEVAWVKSLKYKIPRILGLDKFTRYAL